MEASPRMVKVHWPGLNSKSFIATSDGVPIYGGIFLDQVSAMGIDFPVIYAKTVQDRVTFVLRPSHSMFQSYKDIDPKVKKRIEREEVKDFFSKLRKLI